MWAVSLSYPRPTRPSSPRYLLAALGSIVVIAGYSLVEPSCKFLGIGTCDSSTPNFSLGIILMGLGAILLAGVWINRIHMWRKANPTKH